MLLTIQHASALVGVSVQTLRRWDKSGVLRARRLPGSTYRMYDEAELRAWLARTQPDAPSPVAITRDASLVGRDAELAELTRSVATGAGITVILGAAGVGKTRLVREWLGTRSEEKLFVHAGASTTLEELALVLGIALGLGSRAPTPAELAADVERALGSHREAIVVIDEAENLDVEARAFLGSVARQVQHLVVTTRVRPHHSGERIVQLDPLAYPTAGAGGADTHSVKLFLERAVALDRRDEETIAAACEIARRLEGLPLAIELAAARAAAIGVEHVRRELRASIETLDQSHASLRRAFESSFRRLSDSTRELLEHAVLLPDDFLLEDLERVAGGLVVERLQTLVEHSLVRSRPRVGARAMTFTVHGLVRQLVIDALHDERRAALESTHARHLAEEAGRLARETSTDGLRRLRQMEPTMLRAWHFWVEHSTMAGAASYVVDIARALGRLAEAHGPSPSIVTVLSRSVEIAARGGVSEAHRADLVRHRAFTSLFQSRLDEARAGYREALALARSAADAQIEARVCCQLAWIALRDGDVAARDGTLAEAERALVLHPDALATMELATLRGQVDVLHSRFSSARRHFEKARITAVRMRDQTSETTTTGFLGVVAFEEGALDEAVQHYDRAIAAAIGCGSNVFEAIYRGYRAIALHHMNDDRAAVAYEDAIRVAQAAHAVRFEKLFTAWYGSLLAARGDVDAASRAYDSAAELTDPQAAAFFEMHRAHLDLAWADRAAAGSTERARHEARACRRLDVVRVDASTPRELRVGRRFLEQTLRARASTQHDADVVVGWQGRWLEVARRRVSLAGRVPLQHVVWELALRRVLEPGIAVRAEELFEVAWRGEKASANAALHRLHVALSTLRRLGLRDFIELEDGYRFARARTFQLAFAD